MLKLFEIAGTNSPELWKESNYISVLFSFAFRGGEFKFIKPIRTNVALMEKNDKPIDIKGLNDSVCNIYIQTKDHLNYKNLNNDEKKRWQIDVSFNALEKLFEAKSWDISKLHLLKSKMLSEINTLHIPMFKKQLKSISKKYSVMIKLIPDLDRNSFVCCFYDKDQKEIWSKVFFEGYTTFIYWKRFFKTFKWEDDNIFKITDELDEFSFVFNLNELKLEIICHATQKNKEECLEFINSWRYDTKNPMVW